MRRVIVTIGSARNAQLFLGIFALLALSAALAGCGGSSASTPAPAQPTQPAYPFVPPVAITWSPQTSPLPAPPAQVPPPTPSDDFPLTVSNPTAGVSLTSPINVVATAAPKNPIFFMRVYVDQLAVYFTFTNSIDTQIFLAPGQHTIEVMAEDNQGYISATPITVTVTTQAQTTISNIQSLPGWQSCSATFPPGSGRAGQICAAGLGTAVSTMTQNQSTPSMDGQSAHFTMGGSQPYSNMLYFNPVEIGRAHV